MGRIHKNVLASSTGAVDGPMEQGLKFTPGTLNASVPPQLLPQGVAGHHPRAEKRSEGGGKSGFPTAWWADEQMPLLCWFRQRTVCRAIAPAHQSQAQAQTGADEIEIIAVIPDFSVWIESEPGCAGIDELNSLDF